MTIEKSKKLHFKLSWKLLWLLIPTFILIAVWFPSYFPEWTGFKESIDKKSLNVTESVPNKIITSQKEVTKETTTDRLNPAKSLWDWMTLLLAPATLAGLGFVFQSSQEKYKEERAEADRKRVTDRQREEEKRVTDRQREEKKRVMDQQSEAALQSYLDNLSYYLVDKELGQLLETDVNIDEVDLSIDKKKKAALNVIKAKTLLLLRSFKTDVMRKASVLSFLGDAKLLPELDLDLSDSYWKDAFFRKANLSKANLSKANLSKANLSKANLSGAELGEANLGGADLREADLRGADLKGADLGGADLGGADLTGADLTGAKLGGANLDGANLKRANLREADLRGAKLSGANLRGAKLGRAKLGFTQIKLACYWEQALHDEEEEEKKNTVEKLKQDKSSDPEQCPDCSRWELKP